MQEKLVYYRPVKNVLGQEREHVGLGSWGNHLGLGLEE